MSELSYSDTSAGMVSRQAVLRAMALADGAGPADLRLSRVCAELRACLDLQSPLSPSFELNDRQRRTLELLAMGLSNRVIARRLDMPEETVKSQVRALLDRLRVPNRTSLALWAVREGIVSL